MNDGGELLAEGLILEESFEKRPHLLGVMTSNAVRRHSLFLLGGTTARSFV